MNLKKGLAKLVTTILVFNTCLTFPSAEFIDIYEERSLENVSKGVVHENILRFTDQGWLNINVLRINLNDKDTSLEVLISENGISETDALTKLVSKNELASKIVGAINGDFYDTKAIATIGPIVKDGKLITSSKNQPDFATFNLDTDNNAFIEHWVINNQQLINEKNDFILKIDFKNKPYIDNKVVLLDKDWGNLSFGNEKHQNIVEMVIVNNKVVEIRNNLEAIEIPEDGFVIAAAGSAKEYLLNNFSKNNEVSLDIVSEPDFEKLSLSMGGGAIILKDGNIPDDFSLKIPGRHPRTGLGISKDKKEIIMITIDGRTASYAGTTQRELAEILLELGAYDGINLDGGGSTEMVVKPIGEDEVTIANNPSGGFERRIMNGLAVLNNSSKSSLKNIKLESEDTNIFAGTSRIFTLKGYDKNYNPVEIDSSNAKWSVSGIEGSFDKNKFIPVTTGKGTIHASYNGKTASIDVNVIDTPTKLEVSPSKIIADENQEVPIYAIAINDEGYRAKIDSSDLIWSIPNNIGQVKDNTFIASNKVNNEIIKASLNEINTHIRVSAGHLEVVEDDFENLSGSFLAYPAEVKGSFELSSKEKNGKYSGKLSYDFNNANETKAAYIAFNDGGIHMEEKPVKLGLWVYGNKGHSHWLRGKLNDSKGNSFNITFERNVDWDGWKFVETTIPDNAVAPLKLERLYLVEVEPCYNDSGYIYVDDLTAFYKSEFNKEIPEDTIIYTDKRNTTSELKNENSFKFLSHGRIGNIDTLLDKLVVNKLSNITKEMDLNLFTNHIDSKFEEKLSDNYIVGASGYSHTKFKNSSFIRLDNTNGGIRTTNYNQWIWLLDTVKNINSDSLFVVLPKPLNFNDKLEEKLFLDTFKKLKEERNIDVWIFTGGINKEFSVEAIDGIRIVKLKSYPENSKIDISNDLKYMEFTVNDGYVTYEIKDMFHNE